MMLIILQYFSMLRTGLISRVIIKISIMVRISLIIKMLVSIISKVYLLTYSSTEGKRLSLLIIIGIAAFYFTERKEIPKK